MGRSPPGMELLSLSEAAEFLKVEEKNLRSWAAKGFVEKVYVEKRLRFRRAHLEAVAPLLHGSGEIDIGTIAARANLGFSLAKTLERRLNEVVDLFGLNRNQLDLHPRAVRDLCELVEDALLDSAEPTLEQVRYWAAVLFAIDEAYLLLVQEYVGLAEPWTRFMDLGYKLAAEAPYDRFANQPEMRPAYAYLESARSQLRMVAYFFCRGEHGGSLTDEAFGMRERVTPRILGLLYQP